MFNCFNCFSICSFWGTANSAAAVGVGALLSALGDLTASALKRNCQVKDFGKIFPGHGGFLDRFDSVVFISPFVYFVFFLMKYSPLIFR